MPKQKKKPKTIKYDRDYRWLADKIQPTLKALRKRYFDDYQISEHIQQIVLDELYELWIRWMGEQEVRWSALNNKSFILWLEDGCPIAED